MLTSKPLDKLSKKEYEELKSLGYLYEFYPNATGDYLSDTWTGRHKGNFVVEGCAIRTLEARPEDIPFMQPPTPTPPEAPTSALETQVDGSHYVSMKMQPIELAYTLNASPAFCKLAKYLTRDKGDKLTNLQKALHCIKLEQELVQGREIGLMYSAFRKAEQYKEGQYKTNAVKTVCEFTGDAIVASILIYMYRGEYSLAISGVEDLIDSLNK